MTPHDCLGWWPIDTAPIDGSEILISGHYGCNPEAPQFVVISRWERDEWAHYPARFYLVTHWMPLPTPPDPIARLQEPQP